jgi:hypothetical protein
LRADNATYSDDDELSSGEEIGESFEPFLDLYIGKIPKKEDPLHKDKMKSDDEENPKKIKNQYPEFEEVYFSDEQKVKPKKTYKEALQPESVKKPM